ncbi:MAG: cytidine deaminase [Armatimonadota bacterium]
MISADEFDALITAAKSAKDNAYAPYSGFKVGAAVLADSGVIYRGGNVENASYGLSVCAERAAVFNAISAGEAIIQAIAIAASSGEPAYPCGACRQVLSEFVQDGGDIDVYIISDEGVSKHLLSDLLPFAFKL